MPCYCSYTLRLCRLCRLLSISVLPLFCWYFIWNRWTFHKWIRPKRTNSSLFVKKILENMKHFSNVILRNNYFFTPVLWYLQMWLPHWFNLPGSFGTLRLPVYVLPSLLDSFLLHLRALSLIVGPLSSHTLTCQRLHSVVGSQHFANVSSSLPCLLHIWYVFQNIETI